MRHGSRPGPSLHPLPSRSLVSGSTRFGRPFKVVWRRWVRSWSNQAVMAGWLAHLHKLMKKRRRNGHFRRCLPIHNAGRKSAVFVYIFFCHVEGFFPSSQFCLGSPPPHFYPLCFHIYGRYILRFTTAGCFSMAYSCIYLFIFLYNLMDHLLLLFLPPPIPSSTSST